MFHGRGISMPSHKDWNGQIITAVYTNGMLDGAVHVKLKYSDLTIDGTYLEGLPVGPFVYDEGNGRVTIRIYNQLGDLVTEYTSEREVILPAPPVVSTRPMDDKEMADMEAEEEQRELDMIRANMPTSMIYSPPTRNDRYKEITPEEKMMVSGGGMGLQNEKIILINRIPWTS